MTAKEKAKELVDEFQRQIFFYVTDERIDIEESKGCALIVLNEILNIDNIKPYILHKEIIEFYQEVKQEIEKL